MIRRLLRLGLVLGLLYGIVAVLTKLLRSQATDGPSSTSRPDQPWPRLTSDPGVAAAPVARATPDPDAPRPAAANGTPSAEAWVEPVEGACPPTHRVKAKLASKIFHLPGMANYERTTPDRCYADAAAAEADGLRAAKR
ncbi:MAG: hypothetical protein ACJ739_11075 [Acidimicrobiales bacterium]